jgi:hypothetical protein
MWKTPERGSEAIPPLWKKQTGLEQSFAQSGRVVPSNAASPSSCSLTYLRVSATFTRLYRSSAQTAPWSSYGEADIPSAQHATAQDARVSCAHGNEMGSRNAGSPTEEGTEAVDRPAPGQIRRRLTRPRQHSAFRDMRESRGVQSCSTSRARGSASGACISTFGWQLPLARVRLERERALDSSCPGISTQLWRAIA